MNQTQCAEALQYMCIQHTGHMLYAHNMCCCIWYANPSTPQAFLCQETLQTGHDGIHSYFADAAFQSYSDLNDVQFVHTFGSYCDICDCN